MTLLVYGAYGYTGELIARRAVSRGDRPILAGRSAEPLRDLADDLDCPSRQFGVESAVEHLGDVDAVLNCAGPFARTADPMVDACLRTGTDYLDITGELGVFESLADRHAEAESADVTLLPGVGFDVVPTDCLARHLADRLPEARELSLGFSATGSFSGGTLKTAVSQLGSGGVVRRDGRLVQVPPDWKTQKIDFGRGYRETAVTLPWGDVSTAYRTTGIPTVEVYGALPWTARKFLSAAKYLGPVLSADPVVEGLERLIDARVDGPSEQERASGAVYVWGEARTGAGERAVSRLRTPHTYELTVTGALSAADRTLAGEAPTGYTTPGLAFGADFVTDLPGVERQDGTRVDFG
ncbi:saccharopine dehydrogenase family protein [Salinirubrum litoreum]|uniref:Saccharopine dehydrogenase family protein n=1 Tax=Salinirubrum litoreum TaxID=1126234 RepID=A0ABD5RCS7_9EURY|nr:saccharopine dehydrogenase NADP-binding domain-containing protein [Salinirubrum litoreum]